jgi:hypothetical protein
LRADEQSHFFTLYCAEKARLYISTKQNLKMSSLAGRSKRGKRLLRPLAMTGKDGGYSLTKGAQSKFRHCEETCSEVDAATQLEFVWLLRRCSAVEHAMVG